MSEALDILMRLKKMGKITDADLEDVEDDILDSAKKIYVERIHTATCQKNHDDGSCVWYKEANCWSPPEGIEHNRRFKDLVRLRRAHNLSWDDIGTIAEIIGHLKREILAPIAELFGFQLLNFTPKLITKDSTSPSDD